MNTLAEILDAYPGPAQRKGARLKKLPAGQLGPHISDLLAQLTVAQAHFRQLMDGGLKHGDRFYICERSIQQIQATINQFHQQVNLYAK